MIGFVSRGWSWIVDGLTEALGWLFDRNLGRAPLRVRLGGEQSPIEAANGTVLARLEEEDGAWRLVPPEARGRLAGAAVEVVVPPGWLFRRALEPVAAQGAPFLGAFVQHQIERVTPWRAEDVHVGIRHAPLAGDASRLAVEIGVLPKRLVAGVLGVLQGCDPGRLVLVADAPDGRSLAMPIGDQGARRFAARRPMVALALAGFLVAWPAGLAWTLWDSASIGDDIAAADQVIDERKAVMAAAARHDHAGTESDEALLRLKTARPRAVDVIEALSAALPDTAYATDVSIDKDHVRVSGVATETADLVPALESSGHFADAAFFDDTTRLEEGQGDRFHIEMRTRLPPPLPAGSTASALP